MTTHSMLRKLLEPVYQDRPLLKTQLRAAQAQLNRLRTGAWNASRA